MINNNRGRTASSLYMHNKIANYINFCRNNSVVREFKHSLILEKEGRLQWTGFLQVKITQRTLIFLNIQRMRQHIKLWALIVSPTLHHELVDDSWTSVRRGLMVPSVDSCQNVIVCELREWFLSDGPDLKQHYTIAPYITSSWILLIKNWL